MPRKGQKMSHTAGVERRKVRATGGKLVHRWVRTSPPVEQFKPDTPLAKTADMKTSVVTVADATNRLREQHSLLTPQNARKHPVGRSVTCTPSSLNAGRGGRSTHTF